MSIAVYNADDAKVFINGTQIESVGAITIEFDDVCKCGSPSEYGCHGVSEGAVYSEYLCKKCYNREKRQ